jgi:hypothetical protein
MQSFEMALQQWQAGERRLADAPASERPALDRVVDRLLAELRRRLGGRFTAAELVELYDAGTSWCLDLERPVADAAFARYLRGAVDFAGGRRLEAQP